MFRPDSAQQVSSTIPSRAFATGNCKGKERSRGIDETATAKNLQIAVNFGQFSSIKARLALFCEPAMGIPAWYGNAIKTVLMVRHPLFTPLMHRLACDLLPTRKVDELMSAVAYVKYSFFLFAQVLHTSHKRNLLTHAYTSVRFLFQFN